MASSDILVVGPSGFSQWAGIFSCGIKIAAPSSPLLPMRHVPFGMSLTTRRAPFAAAAQPALASMWREYWGCKSDP